MFYPQGGGIGGEETPRRTTRLSRNACVCTGFAFSGTVLALMNSGGTHSPSRDPGIQSAESGGEIPSQLICLCLGLGCAVLAHGSIFEETRTSAPTRVQRRLH